MDPLASTSSDGLAALRGIRVAPVRIFETWRAVAFPDRACAVAEVCAAEGRLLDDSLAARLPYYPAVLARLAALGLITLELLEALTSDPLVRWPVLVSDYPRFAPLLEASLLENPETAEMIWRYLQQSGAPPCNALSLIQLATGVDPNRAWRALPAGEREATGVRAQLAAQAGERRLESAAWAYFFLRTSPQPAIPDELITVLAREDEYLYHAIMLAAARQGELRQRVELAAHFRTPRWAFHVLRDGALAAAPEAGRRLLRLVHTRPDWAVELWSSRGWRHEWLLEAEQEVRALAPAHPLLPELAAWVQSQRVIRPSEILALRARAAVLAGSPEDSGRLEP